MDLFEKAVSKKIAEMVKDGSIETKISEEVGKAVSKSIEEQFNYGGILKRQIESAVEDGLRFDLKKIDFDSYNQQMLSAIKQKLGGLFHGQAYEHFLSQIDELLEPAPKEVSIDKILEMVAEEWREDDPFYDDSLDDVMEVEIDEYDCGGDEGDWTIQMWKKRKSHHGKNISDLRLLLLGNKIRINHRQKFNPTCFSKAEAFIFKLYAANSTVTGIADCDPERLDLALKGWEC